MRTFFNGVVVGLLFGAVGFWYVQSKVRQHPNPQRRFENSAALMHASTSNAPGYFSDTFTARLEALDLLPRQIKEEMTHGGIIIRRRARETEEKVSAATDTRTVATIKEEFAADPDLSSWQIAVSCRQGHVALSGMVSTVADIGRAIALALETDGVRDVTSTIQVRNMGLAGM